MAHGWEGDLVRLVPLDFDKHFENCWRWMTDPEVTQFLLVGDFPITRMAEKDWFEARSKGLTNTDLIFAIETLDGEHLGTSGIHDIDFRNGSGMTGSLLGDPTQWGKGYGTDAARTRARYAFDVLGLRLLRSSYIEGNERSARMQEKSGYVEIGRWPKAFWKRGSYRDEILTCLTRERWESLQETSTHLV